MSLKDTLTTTDLWSFKPALVSLLTVASLQFVCQLPGWVSTLLIPITLLGYAVALFSILIVAVYCIIKKHPRRGASIFSMLLLPVLFWLPINRAADLVHLGLTAGFGIGQLGVPSKSSDGSFIAYNWSVGLAISPGTFLIHDATDEIALPPAQHTHPPDSEMGFGEECAGTVRRLVRHYYVCSF